MDFILYNLWIILILFVGSSFCGDPKDISSYDSDEVDSNKLTNDPLAMETLESSKLNLEKGSSLHEPVENNTTKRKRIINYTTRKLTCLGSRYKGNKAIPLLFQQLEPAKVNPHNLTQCELEWKFHKLGVPYWMRELKEYPVAEYTNYWAHVCDYFWVKELPEEPPYRACYIKPLLFSENASAIINYVANRLVAIRAEVLRCSCHYYIQNARKSISPSVVFAIHKYSLNEYFILTKSREDSKNTFKITKFWTNVMLPSPIK